MKTIIAIERNAITPTNNIDMDFGFKRQETPSKNPFKKALI